MVGCVSSAVKSGTWCWSVVGSFRLLDALYPIGDTMYPVVATYGCIRDVRDAVWCSRCNRPVVGGWSTLSSGVVSWGLVSDCLLCRIWLTVTSRVPNPSEPQPGSHRSLHYDHKTNTTQFVGTQISLTCM